MAIVQNPLDTNVAWFAGSGLGRLDATVVRMVLVPALAAAWSAPGRSAQRWLK